MQIPDKKKGKQKDKGNNRGLRERLSETLELPKEIILNIPKTTIMGNSSLAVENYKGILEYEADKLRIDTERGIIKIQGDSLCIREITSENIVVMGKIRILEFME